MKKENTKLLRISQNKKHETSYSFSRIRVIYGRLEYNNYNNNSFFSGVCVYNVNVENKCYGTVTNIIPKALSLHRHFRTGGCGPLTCMARDSN